MESLETLLHKYLGHPGRMISGSKSGYRKLYPDNVVIFNSNVVLESKGKVWWGDLDCTIDITNLINLSIELDEPIYIFHEMDFRFENESLSLNEARIKADRYYIINKSGLEIKKKGI